MLKSTFRGAFFMCKVLFKHVKIILKKIIMGSAQHILMLCSVVFYQNNTQVTDLTALKYALLRKIIAKQQKNRVLALFFLKYCD